MNILDSKYQELLPVEFPRYAGRQKYMHSFGAADPWMPDDLEDYLPVVSSLLRAARIDDREVYVTIDEKLIQAGQSQRRPGPHVDGCFTPKGMNWGHGSGWNHTCNDIPSGFNRMAIIVAASVSGCRAWKGLFSGTPKSDGDCSHIVSGPGEVLPANVGYLLSPDCIHESMPLNQPVQRQFLRIAFAP